ncbi:hypothetical protein ARMGADRAFT_1082225 [Armillaria gallica]|uniref:Uncharacterized protein n=1 Tax=Armillaria gallica TaxID=47427 RepID=A0A2H3DA52_ARMGA|nr:hypothetical protein ARMGADRAFT_1082225 [Armillaria gallica]
MGRTRNELIRIVTDSIDSNIPESIEQKTAVLQLARNVFVCKGCGARELFYPEVLAHDCCRRPPYPPRTVLSDLERRFGLDANTTTVRDIDPLEHYYLCLIRQRANLGSGGFKNIYGWRSFIRHMDHHYYAEAGNTPSYPGDFEILPSASVETDGVQPDQILWRCVHCRELPEPVPRLRHNSKTSAG